ncbi:Superfamily I DNA or RNA helicase [Nakamurella panacisegetis]|uniref:DNA 3'-5' helicase n=1 Tax=Nakamurella panacisegetis TaxID=1090615 RepID=A0A1H0SNU3_9ACTN|nr:ATP-dependent DNA helicase [Nakamurella panacisegetis]SDP42928.1 Superfamily I DNA or RNA helicase [Nakamurella panacisegetis]
MSSPTSVTYRLRPVPSSALPMRPTPEQHEVVTNTAPRLRVLAGPGTGKTATLVESVADRILARGVPPEQVLVLTFSRRAAGELSGRISRRLGLTTRETMVRTLHAYAYSVVRAQAARAGEPRPRLLAAGESDHMVRELLAGHVDAHGGPWPEYLTGALSSPTFATELREILLRAAGQGISPQRMIELGRRHKRPEWVAAGRFAREYQQVSDLRQGISGFGVALDQAELTAAALGALSHDDVLADEQRRIRRIFVDEYQDVDPAQARLIDLLSGGADELVVLGDPDQSIYAFRGAEPNALRDIAVDRTVCLTTSRRLPVAVLEATRRTAALLPGAARHRDLVLPSDEAAGQGTSGGRVEVKVFSSPAREAAYVADELRRAHLLEGMPWGSMAILLRSPSTGLAALTRACAVAGVPVLVGGRTDGLAAEPVVAALLTVLDCGLYRDRLTGEIAVELLTGALGGMDALGLRRLRRALRLARPGEGASADLVAAALAGAPIPDGVPRDLAGPVRRVRELLEIARVGSASPGAEQLLWQLWTAAGLEAGLVAAVERGGSAGQRADRALDAVLGLFAMAADLADRLPLAGVPAFIAEVRGHQLPGQPDLTRAGDAVALLSAHAAKGLEWDVVAVCGVQEASWPDLRGRGSLLGGQQLLDLAAAFPIGSPTAGLLAEERRLFYVAATRARRTLVCTGVQTQDAVPSRFLAELAGSDTDLPVELERSTDGARRRRGLHLSDLVADLRRAVTDPAGPESVVAAAATHLAELAAAGVPGTHPDDWYGLPPLSASTPPVAPGAEIRVSPSLIETLNTCALRAVLERRGGRTAPGQAQIEGIVVHAMANGLALGIPEPDLRAEIETFLAAQDQLPPWQLDRTRRGLLAMLSAARIWVRDNHPPRTLIGSELELDLPLPADPDAAPTDHPVRLVGRVDWLSAGPDGGVVVTDFKTAAKVPTKAEAQNNAQLAAYQAAIELGAFAPDIASSGAQAGRAGGAELVFLRSGSPKVLPQDRLSAESTTQWLGSIRAAAQHLASAGSLAQENARCERCPVRTSCPLQNEGRQVRG